MSWQATFAWKTRVVATSLAIGLFTNQHFITEARNPNKRHHQVCTILYLSPQPRTQNGGLCEHRYFDHIILNLPGLLWLVFSWEFWSPKYGETIQSSNIIEEVSSPDSSRNQVSHSTLLGVNYRVLSPSNYFWGGLTLTPKFPTWLPVRPSSFGKKNMVHLPKFQGIFGQSLSLRILFVDSNDFLLILGPEKKIHRKIHPHG